MQDLWQLHFSLCYPFFQTFLRFPQPRNNSQANDLYCDILIALSEKNKENEYTYTVISIQNYYLKLGFLINFYAVIA